MNDGDKENGRVGLTVLGITRSQVQSGAYAMLLAVEGGPLRIPVVVGVAEAQSIAFWLEHVQSPRPLTHDLMVSMMHAFLIGVTEVEIYRFAEGVFYARVSMAAADGTEVQLDSRTSDAIALALRTGAPIYATREVVELTSFKAEPADNAAHMRLNSLRKRLSRAVADERYEDAAAIQRQIKECERGLHSGSGGDNNEISTE